MNPGACKMHLHSDCRLIVISWIKKKFKVKEKQLNKYLEMTKQNIAFDAIPVEKVPMENNSRLMRCRRLPPLGH